MSKLELSPGDIKKWTVTVDKADVTSATLCLAGSEIDADVTGAAPCVELCATIDTEALGLEPGAVYAAQWKVETSQGEVCTVLKDCVVQVCDDPVATAKAIAKDAVLEVLAECLELDCGEDADGATVVKLLLNGLLSGDACTVSPAIKCECAEQSLMLTIGGEQKAIGPSPVCDNERVGSADTVDLDASNAQLGTVVASGQFNFIAPAHGGRAQLDGKGGFRTNEGTATGNLGVQFQYQTNSGAWLPFQVQGGSQDVASPGGGTAANEDQLNACGCTDLLVARKLNFVRWRLIVTNEPSDPGSVSVSFRAIDVGLTYWEQLCNDIP